MGDVRVSQVAVESVATGDGPPRISQVVVETVASNQAAPAIRASQVVVEAICLNPFVGQGFNALLIVCPSC